MSLLVPKADTKAKPRSVWWLEWAIVTIVFHIWDQRQLWGSHLLQNYSQNNDKMVGHHSTRPNPVIVACCSRSSARAFIPDIFSNLGDFISRSLRFKIAYLLMSWKLKVLMSTKYLLSNMIIQQYLKNKSSFTPPSHEQLSPWLRVTAWCRPNRYQWSVSLSRDWPSAVTSRALIGW